MPVFLATWEAEIGKIRVSGQPGQKSFQDLISKEKAGYAACTCHPSSGGKHKVGRSWSR
jgi:hypothetical protein